MPIANRWWTFTDYVCNYEKDDSGVYELGATNDLVVYIGSSNELRRRLKEHLAQPVTSCIKRNTNSTVSNTRRIASTANGSSTTTSSA